MKNHIKLLSVALLVAGATQGFAATANIVDDAIIGLIRIKTKTTSGPITGAMFKETFGSAPKGTVLQQLNGRAGVIDKDNLCNSFDAMLLKEEFSKALGTTQAKALGLSQTQGGQEYTYSDAIIGLIRKETGTTRGLINGGMFQETFGYLCRASEKNRLNARVVVVDEAISLCDSFNIFLLKSEFANALGLIQAHQAHPLIKFLNTHVTEKSTEFFNGLLLTKQFDLARNFGQAYAMRDAALSADWLRIVTAAKEDDDRVRAATAARLVVADEKERGLAESEITVARLEAELTQARAERDRFAREKAEMIRIRKDDAERLAARADDLKRSKPPVFKAK